MLTLVRHTRPRVAGSCYGRSDVALADSFEAEAEAALAGFAAMRRIVSSPLGRCRRLAERIGGRLGLAVTLDEGWREMDFGRWEGVAWDAIPRGEIDAWAADFLGARPHGGESVAMLLARTRQALARALEAGEPTLVVTHAGVIRAALVACGEPGWEREIGFAEAVAIDPRRLLPAPA